jgi:hypothetical protein
MSSLAPPQKLGFHITLALLAGDAIEFRTRGLSFSCNTRMTLCGPLRDTVNFLVSPKSPLTSTLVQALVFTQSTCGRSLPGGETGLSRCGRVPENPRSPRSRPERTDWCAGTLGAGQGLRSVARFEQRPMLLTTTSFPSKRRRSRCSYPEASVSGLRELQ